jgi:glucose 1-dehydrogenase
METKHAVIVGGAGEMASYVAKGLVSEGCTISLIDINEKKCQELQEEMGNDKVDIYICDITDFSRVKDVVDQILKKKRAITYLLNSVAYNDFLPLEDTTLEHMQKTIDACLLIYAYMGKLFYGHFTEEGSIVNISSVHAHATKKGNLMYAAVKGGVVSLTKALTVEYREQRVRVNVVSPGGFINEMYKQTHPDWEVKVTNDQVQSAQSIGDIILFLFNEKSKAINGAEIVADGGISAKRVDSKTF